VTVTSARRGRHRTPGVAVLAERRLVWIVATALLMCALASGNLVPSAAGETVVDRGSCARAAARTH
jgi:hypothetical protein